jgi:hypothetical protein
LFFFFWKFFLLLKTRHVSRFVWKVAVKRQQKYLLPGRIIRNVGNERIGARFRSLKNLENLENLGNLENFVSLSLVAASFCLSQCFVLFPLSLFVFWQPPWFQRPIVSCSSSFSLSLY